MPIASQKSHYLRQMNRRDLLKLLGIGSTLMAFTSKRPSKNEKAKPLVIST